MLPSSSVQTPAMLLKVENATPNAPPNWIGNPVVESIPGGAAAALAISATGNASTPLRISVPFASGYKTGWTTLGIVSGWALAALGLSYYARARIGQDRWRSLHRFTALAWILGLAHSLGEGTDAGQTWFLVMIGIVAVPALVLLLWRMSGLGHHRSRSPSLSQAAA